MSWFEVAFGAHYPLLYAHRGTAEARRAVNALRRLAPLGDGPCLDLGCGAGRHLAPLGSGGTAPVVGLDLSAPLLGAARRAAGGSVPPCLVRGDMRRLPLGGAAFTAVVSLFTSFGYFGSLPAHAGLVAEIARVLRPGGHWYLDYLDCDAVRRELSPGAELLRRRVRGPLAVEERRTLAGDRVIKHVRVRPRRGRVAEAAKLGVPRGGLTYAEEVALFTTAEMDALARAAGLIRAAAAGGYDGEPLGAAGASRWVLVYRREDARD